MPCSYYYYSTITLPIVRLPICNMYIPVSKPLFKKGLHKGENTIDISFLDNGFYTYRINHQTGKFIITQ